MNIKSYIKRGIIKSYLIALASEADQQEFESLFKQYLEILDARHALEIKLEKQLMKDGMHPPKYLKKRIFKHLKISGDSSKIYKKHKLASPQSQK